MKQPEKMTAVELAKVLEKAEVIESWLRGVRAMAAELIEEGMHVPGWKLVPKKGMRKWKNEAEAKERLAKNGLRDFCVDSLVSPTQAEKLCKKQGIECSFADLITSESSGVNLVREDDRRVPANMTASKDFAGL